MKNLMRRLSFSRVTHSPEHHSLLRSDSSAATARRSSPSFRRVGACRSSHVPAGHFPVYVGVEEAEKFVVNAELLHHPIFVELLNIAAQEYGYEQRGVLRIPVNVVVFERLLELLRLGQEPSSLDDLVESVIPAVY